MITLTNYTTGELLISDGAGHSIRLDRDRSNRLIMTARMHTVTEFVEKLPSLVSDKGLVGSILNGFDGRTSTQRWNLKEKFARLHTLTKECLAPDRPTVVEVVALKF